MDEVSLRRFLKSGIAFWGLIVRGFLVCVPPLLVESVLLLLLRRALTSRPESGLGMSRRCLRERSFGGTFFRSAAVRILLMIGSAVETRSLGGYEYFVKVAGMGGISLLG